MALTGAQKLALFEILEVPFCAIHGQVSENGLYSTEQEADASWAAKNAIETHISGVIEVDASLETALKVYVDRWIALGTKTIRIDGGSVGNVSGVIQGPQEERQLIMQRVVVLVPFYRSHLQMMDQGQSVNIPSVR
jgi:hypothetical protein